jgi:hypothetical protein
MFEHSDPARREEAEAIFAARGRAELFFGANEKRAKLRYKHLAAMFHPDMFTEESDRRDAERVFKELGSLWDAYKDLLNPKAAVSGVLTIDGVPHSITGAVQHISNRIFKAFALKSERDDRTQILFVSRAPNANKGYPRALDRIARNGVCGHLFVAPASDAFMLMQADGGHTAFTARFPDGVLNSARSLQYAAESGKLDAKDAAWIWRRLVSAAAVCADLSIGFDFFGDAAYIEPNDHGYIHMCIDPSHGRYEEGLREAAGFMAAICDNAPPQMERYFTAIGKTESASYSHPADLLADFDYILEKLWGERKFHAFKYPHNWN